MASGGCHRIAERRSLAHDRTRLSIDRLRAAQVERESYVGPWLPERLIAPITDHPDGRPSVVGRLTMLERLTAQERATFLLQVFDHARCSITLHAKKKSWPR